MVPASVCDILADVTILKVLFTIIVLHSHFARVYYHVVLLVQPDAQGILRGAVRSKTLILLLIMLYARNRQHCTITL